MAGTYMGRTISLISHSDVRYRGVLQRIDPANSTIQLSNVFSMGTESRRPPAEFIAPNTEPYQYIIFRASEVKDLAVEDPVPLRPVNADPAVLNSAPMPPAGAPPPFFAGQQPGVPHRQPSTGPQSQFIQRAPTGPPAGAYDRPAGRGGVNTATASLETVERAIGDLRHGGRGEIKAGDLRVPVADFDFEGSNRRFNKDANPKANHSTSNGGNASNGNGNGSSGGEGDAEEKDGSYNPKKSFFDGLTASAGGPGGERGRGRGRGGRTRREEERERNVATFGEPGGLGLLGPGAYVGGWGGYGRRGGHGGRGYQGGPRGRGRAGMARV